jgi:HlyD family secretion protein
MKKKRSVWPIFLVVLLLVLAGAVVFFVMSRKNTKEESTEKVYVESVANITGSGFSNSDKFMGVVESQDVKYVDKSSDKTVKEIYVEEGDTVKEGDELFSYDTDEMALQLKQLELELTSINNSISTSNQQIATLSKERDQAPAEEKIDYTTQIQSIQTQINQYNYDASSKQLEIDRQNSAIENSVVYAPMDGIIKSINSDNSTSSDSEDYSSSGDDSGHFMSIMAMGDYRIKCTGDEMNVRSLSTGQNMIIVSRTDETASWTGSITSVDLENPVSDNNSYYYSSSDRTTKYSFYVDLDSTDGLILGQHVYAELDYGQGTAKSGLWLYEYYIVQDDGEPYVWTENSNGKIEKRKVTLGEYDEDLMEYEIVSGLETSDYIAFPESRIEEGMTTTRNYEDTMPDMDDNSYTYDEDYDYMYDEGDYEEDYDGDEYEEYYEDGEYSDYDESYDIDGENTDVDTYESEDGEEAVDGDEVPLDEDEGGLD